jgi:hypothetical protein
MSHLPSCAYTPSQLSSQTLQTYSAATHGTLHTVEGGVSSGHAEDRQCAQQEQQCCFRGQPGVHGATWIRAEASIAFQPLEFKSFRSSEPS